MALLIYTILWGIAIGVFVSAPLGPIGVLVIQRTLNKGRMVGLMTGLGAAVSDVMYALISGLGLSFVVDFISANEVALQIVGSLVIAVFGVYLWRTNPLKGLEQPQTQTTNHTTYFVTGFLLTLSNPFIIFIYLALFARTNFLLNVSNPAMYVIGYFSVAVGALIWWFFITWAMGKARNHFKLRSLYLINKIIGVVMLIVSLVGLVHGLMNVGTKSPKYEDMNMVEQVVTSEIE